MPAWKHTSAASLELDSISHKHYLIIASDPRNTDEISGPATTAPPEVRRYKLRLTHSNHSSCSCSYLSRMRSSIIRCTMS